MLTQGLIRPGALRSRIFGVFLTWPAATLLATALRSR
jgi:hypothetical protein